jgi:hypothetical protein
MSMASFNKNREKIGCKGFMYRYRNAHIPVIQLVTQVRPRRTDFQGYFEEDNLRRAFIFVSATRPTLKPAP